MGSMPSPCSPSWRQSSWYRRSSASLRLGQGLVGPLRLTPDPVSSKQIEYLPRFCFENASLAGPPLGWRLRPRESKGDGMSDAMTPTDWMTEVRQIWDAKAA